MILANIITGWLMFNAAVFFALTREQRAELCRDVIDRLRRAVQS